ncbi:VOC family protein [Methylococcus capsulatus]|jgi:catechol 2,3-dioxygenase-like lactoylglutathione lyase family enzyme|nr:VOC family protein [Methylococcus capsulatus]QXP92268.1 VOC family protein [Methylococcus capsulatus]
MPHTPLISHLHHVSLLVSDLEASRRFYEGVLELSPSDARPNFDFDGIWYDLGAQQIHLMVLPNPDQGTERPRHGGRDRHVALAVADWEKLLARLARAGIPHTTSRSGRRAVFCRDPDGNAVELIGPAP